MASIPLRESLLPNDNRPTQAPVVTVVVTAAPLLLAIAGSALAPLPCAFSLAGVSGGTALLLAIGMANDYTTVLMVRAASRCGVTGYEEVVSAAGGPRALWWCRAALVLLLFGTICGALAAIQETGDRAIVQLFPAWSQGHPGTGGTSVLVGATVLVLLPLSTASLGELPFVSVLGVLMMLGLAGYVVFLAASDTAGGNSPTLSGQVNINTLAERQAPQQLLQADASSGGMLSFSEAASTFGYAFYVQPCAIPLLRTLPAGDEGARLLCHSVHLTFIVTALAYLCVGLGGLLYFGEGHVPQNLLQGFSGRVGGTLAGVFCTYLMLCVSPIVVPLRETLVRLYREQSHLQTNAVGLTTRRWSGASSSAAAAAADPAVLDPGPNALATAGIVGAALIVAVLLPNASSALFALTGATGVCAIGYCFPIFAYWTLPPQLGGAAAPIDSLSSKVGEPYNPFVTPQWTRPNEEPVAAPLQRPADATAALRQRNLLVARVLPAAVLMLGVGVSIFTLIEVFDQVVEQRTTCSVDVE